MATKDAAFLWETEALRVTPTIPATGSLEREEGWATLRETQAATGIPISTLRKWVRKDAVPSFIEETDEGPIRMLWLQSVKQRGEVLGREMTPEKGLEHPGDETDGPEERAVEVDISEGSTRADPPAPPVDDHTQNGPATDPTPPGTMVVPIEAWDKMLLQLGNLHEAGQQLAEARERAAKAETEALFLRERLAEMRADATARPQPAPGPASQTQASRRVNIEIEDEDDHSSGETIDVREAEPDLRADEPEPEGKGSSISTYSVEVIKHLYGTWRDRPRR